VTAGPTRRVTLLVAAAVLGGGLSIVAAAPAAGATVGYARLAHLSPDTPPVDVYLSSVTGAIPQQVFNAVGYGVMSKYMALPPGAYAVAMRAVGAAPTSPPILSAQATIEAGKAYTVVGAGERIRLGIKVFVDDLGAPESGKSKVRVIQASVKQPKLDVKVADGETIASNIEFATTTDYRQVGSGRFTLRLSPSGGTGTTTVSAPLSAGAVYSLIVLDGKNGALTAELRTDAKGGSSVPFGGVDTGGGGMADEVGGRTDGGSSNLVPATLALAVLLIAAFGGLLWRRNRLRLRQQ
jgi:hypothetical protein